MEGCVAEHAGCMSVIVVVPQYRLRLGGIWLSGTMFECILHQYLFVLLICNVITLLSQNKSSAQENKVIKILIYGAIIDLYLESLCILKGVCVCVCLSYLLCKKIAPEVHWQCRRTPCRFQPSPSGQTSLVSHIPPPKHIFTVIQLQNDLFACK